MQDGVKHVNPPPPYYDSSPAPIASGLVQHREALQRVLRARSGWWSWKKKKEKDDGAVEERREGMVPITTFFIFLLSFVSLLSTPSRPTIPSRGYENQIRDISVFSPVGFGFIHPNVHSFL